MSTLSQLEKDPKAEAKIKQRAVSMMFAYEVEEMMERAAMNQSSLADSLGKSRAWVSKLLGGPQNMTVLTAVEVANALSLDVEMHLVDRDTLQPVAKFPAVSPAQKRLLAAENIIVRATNGGAGDKLFLVPDIIPNATPSVAVAGLRIDEQPLLRAIITNAPANQEAA